MDKTFNNLMDIVSRTKKIDEKEGRVSRPRPKVENDTSFDEPKKELKPARTSLFEGKDAINNYLSTSKTKKTKGTSKTTKSTAKKTTKKATKTATKKSTTKSTKSAKTSTKKKDVAEELLKNIDDATKGVKKEDKKARAKDIADKFQLINKKKVVKPTNQAPVLDMNDPKNVELYNALKETLLAGGTDVSEYMNEGVTAKQLGELISQKKAQNINEEITREQQEYEKLFTGSFFDEATPNNEEMTDDSLQEYFAKQQAQSDESNAESMADIEDNSTTDEQKIDREMPVRRNRFDADLDEFNNRDRELDEKIADYYKRKQEKINEYTKSQIDDAYVEDKKPESENIDYADIFNGEVEKRSVVLGEEEPEEEIPEEVVEEQTPQETDFQSLYHSLNADNFEEYTERFVTPASEQVHGETFVSERELEEPIAENTYDNENADDEEENNQTFDEEVADEENAYNQTFTDDELVDSEMLEAKHIDDSEEDNDIYDLSDDDSLDDYIVSSNIPYESDTSDEEDNTMVINSNDLPENKFDYLSDNLEDNLDEENGERIIDGDAISKQEFYSEMARLQENLINQLKSETKVEEEKVEVQAPQTNMSNSTLDKALDIINHLTQTKQEQPAPVYDSKANAVADQLIENIDKEMQIDKVMEEENSQVDSSEEEDNGEKDYNQIFASVEEVVEEETPQEEVEEVTFNGDSLLNKDVALNDSDLQYIVNSEKLKSEKKDYFYMSEEDKEKKKEDESYIQKTASVDGKEMGDINLNKDLANAIPTVEIIANEQNPTPIIDDMEVIHTIFGVQKKKVEKMENEIKVLYVTSECLPFIATGGLADVAGSLPKAINKSSDVDVRVIMPLYGKIKNEYGDKLEYICNFTVHLSWRQEYCGLFKYTVDGVTYYFVDNERYFKRDSLYGFYDDGERFAYFCKAVVEGLPMLNFFPDIIHCNDWQSALVSTYIKTGNWSDFRYYKIKNIYTIHNVEYQGIYGMENLKDLFGIDYRFKNDLDYNGDINLTKAAIQFSDKFTTVSNSYCDNLKQPYCSRGLNHIIVRNEYKLCGIINGIDLDFYNPATDSVIYKNYDINTLDDKVYNKKILQDELGLPVDAKTPLIGMATRLVSHKGLDLVTKILEGILEKDVQFVIVGTGDQRYIDYFKYLENKYPTKVRALVDKYSNENARKLYASSDIFLMPSKIEPCGISQMIASRYGSVPIVREVGGLKDTIRDFGCAGGGNGYTFANYNPNDLEFQINRALSDYRDEIEWKKKMRTIMSMDFSWENSARKYIDLYKSLVD